MMRIVSLVPSGTEIAFALGLGDQIVGVTHECDYPAAANDLPKVTRDVLPPGLSAGEIDRAVRERTAQGLSIYELDEQALDALAPDLIITQALCAVCAVSYDDVRAIATRMSRPPHVVSLDPHTVDEIIADIETVAALTQQDQAAQALVNSLRKRIARVQELTADRPKVPVAAIEWLDPVFIAGHWTPELIAWAGGNDVLGQAGQHSAVRSWDEVRTSNPTTVVLMPCGYDTARSHEEALKFGAQLQTLDAQRYVAVDAAGLFSRPGPRCIEGLEVLAHIFHPDVVPAPCSPTIELEFAR